MPVVLAPAGKVGTMGTDATAAPQVLGKRVATHQSAATAGKAAVRDTVKQEKLAAEKADCVWAEIGSPHEPDDGYKACAPSAEPDGRREGCRREGCRQKGCW